MNTLFETLIRVVIGFVILFALIRLLGQKQLSEMSFFTYVTGVALGNIAGDMVVHRDIKLIDGVVGIILWGVFTFILEYTSLKSSKVRAFLDGEPTIVIKKGEIIEKSLSKIRLNLDDLTMLLRNNNVFSIKDVDYAILEPNGQLSVLKKQVNNPEFIPLEIISDGNIVARNLKEISLDETWLKEELKLQGINSEKEVLYAELQSDRSLYIKKKLP